MKKLLLALFTTVVIISLPIQEVKAQDPITEYEGIPLVIYWANPERITYPLNYEQMRDMGVYAAVTSDPFDIVPNNNFPYLEYFREKNIKVIPSYLGSPLAYWIYVYTDAHYTVWETEGPNPPESKAMLFYDTSYTKPFSEENKEGRKTDSTITIPEGEVLIWGPGYPQNVTHDRVPDVIDYMLDYKMKITQKTTPPPGYENDTVCIIKVTNLRALPNTIGVIEETVDSFAIKVSDFIGWDMWSTIDTTYNLGGFGSYDRGITGHVQPRAGCVQFKIIWEGLDYLNLWIDKIIVSDDPGRLLKDPLDPTARNRIASQVQPYLSDTTIIGWYGFDEPACLDQYEPFRIVDSIITALSLQRPIRLHTGFFGGWNGKYREGFWGWDYPDTLSLVAYQDEEFWLRAKQKNLQMNVYNYHYPYVPEQQIPDWIDSNITYVTDTYLDRINDIDTAFAFSTQAGAYTWLGENCENASWLIMPTPSQILYHVNLGLMYGARELRLDPFFSDTATVRCNGVSYFIHPTDGLIDVNNDTTANYNLFRFKIVPRLSGWFGKDIETNSSVSSVHKVRVACSGSL